MADDEVNNEYEVEDRIAADDAFFAADEATLPFGAFSSRLLAAAVHAAETTRADPEGLRWIPIGPRNIGGRIAALAQDPVEPRTLYAGAAFGGLWKTTDGGDSWRPLNSFLEPDSAAGAADRDVALPVGAIGICHRNPQVIYVGTGESRGSTHEGSGLYRSDDGGQTFTRLEVFPFTAGLPAPVINARGYDRIEVDPWNADRCWIACHTGLWRREPTAGNAITQDRINATTFPAGGTQNVTDIAIHFGTRTDAAAPATFTVYAAVSKAVTLPDGTKTSRIVRATFNTATNAYDPVPGSPPAPNEVFWEDLTPGGIPVPAPEGASSVAETARVKIALCRNEPSNLYAVADVTGQSGSDTLRRMSRIIRSTDGGQSWTPTAVRPVRGGASTIPWYALCIAVHPDDPRIVFVGSRDLFRTINGGESWEYTIYWEDYRRGQTAKHSDQHALLFDEGDPRKVWAGNDGGVSETRDVGLTWRKRSYGISAAQFYEFATHPTYPFVMAGGFQDNGSWVSFGGTTWYQYGVADGGGVGFQPGDVAHFASSWQGGFMAAQVQFRMLESNTPPGLGRTSGGDYLLGARLADRPLGTEGGSATYPFLVMATSDMDDGVDSDDTAQIFGRKMEGHPTAADTFLFAWTNDAYRTRDGTLAASPVTLRQQPLGLSAAPPGFTAGAQTSALTFEPGAADHWWVGNTAGQVFYTSDGGATWVDITPNLGTGTEITGIAIHPTNHDIVVVTTRALTNNVHLSADATATTGPAGAPVTNANWRTISHASGTGAGVANRDLPRGPATRAVIDPSSPAVDPPPAAPPPRVFQTVYVATLAGVYVCRNATSEAAEAPLWHTLNAGMPIVLVRDLDVVTTLNAAGTAPVRTALRAASFGRGVFECDLAGAPDARLFVRSTAIEDSHPYAGAQALATDPRLNEPGTGAPAFDHTRAIDIRIDPPPYAYFGEDLDGVEFDEDLRTGTLVIAERNFVYVQVHTRGALEVGTTPDPVRVHLYFAAATAGTPPSVPDLQADFWTTFPAAPGDAATWRRAGEGHVTNLHAGQPRVARIEWVPPADLAGPVALLAIAEQSSDPVPGGASAPPLHVGPGAGALIPAERRTALFVTEARRAVPDIYVRDGVGDTGEPGAVAWGGRTADIIVAAEAEEEDATDDPDATFPSLADPREADRIRAGRDNLIFVRAHNRSTAAASITVRLQHVPMAQVANPADWQEIGEIVVPVVGAGEWRIAGPFTWSSDDIPDPAPGSDIKAHVLVALVGSEEDPAPDPAGISSLGAFWAFFRSAENANNASFRAIRHVPEGG